MRKSGFTIVELLVVIVVIGILAALTIVAYTGISQKAIVASLQSDLDNASKQLKLFQVDNMAYPNSVTDCPTPSTGNLCLKVTSGNTYSSYSANNTTSPQTFTLTATHNDIIYKVTDTAAPVALAPAPLSPVADWLATTQGDHYGNFYDLVSHGYATVTRAGAKTIYDPNTQKIYDVPSNQLGVNPRSDGKGGSEAVIEEARTNYISYSSFETDANSDGRADGWGRYTTAGLTNDVYSRVSGVHVNYGQRITYSGGDSASGNTLESYSNQSAAGSFAPGDIATSSVFMKGNLNGATVRMQIRAYNFDASSYQNYNSTDLAVTSNWQKFTFTSSALWASASRIMLEIQVIGVHNTDSFDITFDSAQIEKGAFATSYIPTTTTAATRNTENVTVTTAGWGTGATGTIIAVAGQQASTTYPSAFLAWGGYSDNWRVLRATTSTNLNARVRRASVPTDVFIDNATLSAGGYRTVAMNWIDGGKVRAYVNGGPPSVSAANCDASNTPVTAYLGYAQSDYWYNGPISRLLIYSSALSDADITTVTNAINDGP